MPSSISTHGLVDKLSVRATLDGRIAVDINGIAVTVYLTTEHARTLVSGLVGELAALDTPADTPAVVPTAVDGGRAVHELDYVQRMDGGR